MVRRISIGLGVLAIAAWAMPASAALTPPTVDGTRAGDTYGGPRAVQTVNTEFGDNASEWNAAWGTIVGGKLHLMLTGNHEGNFNKVEIFIDSVAGGSNVLSTIGNDGSGVMNGMTLDVGFEPEYHLIARRGNFGGDKYDVDLATLDSGALGPGALIIDGNGGGGTDIFGGFQEGSASGIGGTSLALAYDNSNVAGIVGGTGAANQGKAVAVETGLEISIDLADLSHAGGPIQVMLLQNNDNHDFLSNQTLGGLPAGTGNIGSPAAAVDFTLFPTTDQFFIIPEPASMVLVGLGAALMMRRRRA